MGKHKLIHKFSLMNLTWANVTDRDSAFTGSCSTRAMASWGQHYPLRTAEKLSVFRKLTGWYGIQPYSTHLRQVISDDLMIWFHDLNWVYLIFSGWDDETSIHSSWGLVKSTFRHREPLNTGWKSWDTNNSRCKLHSQKMVKPLGFWPQILKRNHSPIRLCLLSMNIMNYENPIFRFDVFRSLWTADFHAYAFDMFRK